MQKQNEYTQTEEKLAQLVKRVSMLALKLPTIRDNPTAIVTARGTSCRSQIHDAGHSVQHPIEVVISALA